MPACGRCVVPTVPGAVREPPIQHPAMSVVQRRRCAPASPCKGEASFLCFRGNTQRLSFTTHPGKWTPLRPLGGGEGEGEVGARTSPHDTTHPHPALRAGLSLQGRGVFPLLPWEHTVAFLHYAPRERDPSPPPSGAERVKGEAGGSTIARRHDPPSPGAARRPLPGRERRLFVAALETVRTSFLTLQAEQTPLRPLRGRRG